MLILIGPWIPCLNGTPEQHIYFDYKIADCTALIQIICTKFKRDILLNVLNVQIAT